MNNFEPERQYLKRWLQTIAESESSLVAAEARRRKCELARYDTAAVDHNLTPEDVCCVIDALLLFTKAK